MSKEYFYKIKNINTGKYYVGSKWSKTADPNLFWKDGGYFTSSKIVKSLITRYGKDIFIIEELITEFNKESLQDFIETNPKLTDCPLSYVYETKYLSENDCATDKLYYNQHNNDTTLIGFFNEKVKEEYFIKTGFYNPSQVLEVKTKKVQTTLKNYGAEHYLQTEEGVNKIKETNLKRYGHACTIHSAEIQAKIKQNCLNKHGVDHHSKRLEVKTKMSDSAKGKVKSEEHCKNLSKANQNIVSALNLLTGNIERISKDLFDSSPNLYVGATKGKIRVRDKDNNTFMVFKTDPRYLSGELENIGKNCGKYYDENNNIVHISNDAAQARNLTQVPKRSYYVKVKDRV